jgi:uncharacterized protein DUF6932
MSLIYLPNGNLEPGIHLLTWEEFVLEYGYNIRRRDLIEGLAIAIEHLSNCGCGAIYIDGSFVTKERNPTDFDACWDDTDEHIDWQKLRIEYKELSHGTKEMIKMKYSGDIRAAKSGATWEYLYINFFQVDKIDKSAKGIIKLFI